MQRRSRFGKARLVERGASPWPALCDELGAREEADTVFTVLVEVAESRILPTAETVVADRHRHRQIDPDHAYGNFIHETLGRVAAAREDRNRIALLVVARLAQRFFECLD